MLLAGVATLSSTFVLRAQEQPSLRGAVSEADVNSYLLSKQTRDTGQQPTDATNSDQSSAQQLPDYVPISPGALPQEPAQPAAGDSLFPDPVAPGQDANVFDDTPVPAFRQPASAPKSSSQQRQAAEGQPQTAAERIAAEDRALDENATGTVRQGTVDSDSNSALDNGAGRAGALEGIDRSPDTQPFAAPGLRLGTFIFRPTLEQGVTSTSNADSSTNGKAAVLSETTLRLNAVSDWSSHSATIDAYGIYRKSISGDEVEDGEGGIDAALELELGNDYRAKGTLGYKLRPETAESPVIIVGVENEPLHQTIDGSLGLEKDVGKASFSITGSADHDSYGDADLIGGGTQSQRERDATLYSLALRAGYEISPAITPFVQAEIGRNDYQQEVDTAGYQRSSDRLGGSAGVALDLGEKLSGELSAGWIRETFDDDRLKSISSPTARANLNWSPERDTTVRMLASTTLEGTTTAGDSGSVLYSGNISIERLIRADLTGNLSVGGGYRNYADSDQYDQIFNAEAGLTYWLNRYAGITGRARHDQVKSNRPDRDSKTDSVFLGLKLQR